MKTAELNSYGFCIQDFLDRLNTLAATLGNADPTRDALKPLKNNLLMKSLSSQANYT